MLDIQMHIDASKGIDVPAPARFRLILRGDSAVSMRLTAARASKEELIRYSKQSVANSVAWFEPKSVEWRDDPQDNAFELDVIGDADMDWRENGDLHVREFKYGNSTTTAKLFPAREPGPDQGAPFVVAFPLYVKAALEVVLPDGGRNFTVAGPQVDQTIGEYHVENSTGIVGGVAHIDGSVRTLGPEATAEEATEANRQLRHLDNGSAVIRLWPSPQAMKAASAGGSGA